MKNKKIVYLTLTCLALSISFSSDYSFLNAASQLKSQTSNDINLPKCLIIDRILDVYSYDYLELNSVYYREYLNRPSGIGIPVLPKNNAEAQRWDLNYIPLVANSNFKGIWTGVSLETSYSPSFKVYTSTNVKYDSRVVESMEIAISNFTSLDIQVVTSIGVYANVSFYVDAEIERKMGLDMSLRQTLTGTRLVDTSCLDDSHHLYGVYAQFYNCKKIYLVEDYNGNITKGLYFTSHPSSMCTYKLEALD